MKKCLFVLVFVLSFGFTSSAFAAIENFKKSPWTEETTYVEKSIHKLGFGLTNLTMGWTALLFEPVREENKFSGLAKGLWRTVTNTVGGVIHTATFPMPVDVPLPDGGVNFE